MAELTLIVAVGTIIMGTAIPIFTGSMRGLRLGGDARNICAGLADARIKATAQLTHYRVLFNLSQNQWTVEKFNRGTNAYELEGSANYLSEGMAQSGIAFQSTSNSVPSGFPSSSSTTIQFNSRGIPTDTGGTPTSNNVVYLTDGSTNYAVSVSLTGKVQLWKQQDGNWLSQ